MGVCVCGGGCYPEFSAFLGLSSYRSPGSWVAAPPKIMPDTNSPTCSSLVLTDPCFLLPSWPSMARILELGQPPKLGLEGIGFHSSPTQVAIVRRSLLRGRREWGLLESELLAVPVWPLGNVNFSLPLFPLCTKGGPALPGSQGCCDEALLVPFWL